MKSVLQSMSVATKESMKHTDHYINIPRGEEPGTGRHRIGDTFILREDIYALTIRAHKKDEHLDEAFAKSAYYGQNSIMIVDQEYT